MPSREPRGESTADVLNRLRAAGLPITPEQRDLILAASAREERAHGRIRFERGRAQGLARGLVEGRKQRELELRPPPTTRHMGGRVERVRKTRHGTVRIVTNRVEWERARKWAQQFSGEEARHFGPARMGSLEGRAAAMGLSVRELWAILWGS